MAAPPYLMTMVLPWNRCRYGSASDSTFTRSKAENLSSCGVHPATVSLGG